VSHGQRDRRCARSRPHATPVVLAHRRRRHDPRARRPPGVAARGTGDAARLFDARLRADLDAVLRAGYRPTILERMLSEHGAAETAKRLLASPQVSDGFRWLWEHQLLRLSGGNAVRAPDFEELFTDHEGAVAEHQLREASFR
jgi:hypothetical protein